MDVELNFISKAIQTENVQKMIVKGVTSDHFQDEINKEVWDYCNDYIQKYKQHPSLEAVTRDIPEFRFTISSDSLGYLFDEFAKLVTRRVALNGLIQIGEVVDDSEEILNISNELIALGQSIEGIFRQGNPVRYSEMPERIAEYERRKEEGDVYGILTGIPALDELMFGIQPHEVFSIVGYAGTGKSTLAQLIAFNAYMQGKTPLIISLEMEASAIYRKFDVMATHIEYRKLKALELDESDKDLWERAAREAQSRDNDIIVLDNITNCTLEKVYSLGKQYQPDLLVIDYITLMKMPGERLATYEKITALTHALKNMARDPEFPPIVSVAQNNRRAAEQGSELDNIAGSNSVATDSDVVVGLYQNEEMLAQKKMEVRLLKNRDGEKVRIDMFWNPAYMEFEEWNAKHEFSTKTLDTVNQGSVKPKPTKIYTDPVTGKVITKIQGWEIKDPDNVLVKNASEINASEIESFMRFSKDDGTAPYNPPDVDEAPLEAYGELTQERLFSE